MIGRRLEHDDEFRRFAVTFAPTLLRAAYVLVQDIDLAEDVVQATMFKVFRRWDRAREAPEAYTRSTLINVCRDHWRRSARRPIEVALSLVDEPGTASFTDSVDRREALRQALQELPERQREVLTLRYFFDLSVEQTAVVLGIAEGTAKSAASRGLDQLREILTPTTEEKPC